VIKQSIPDRKFFSFMKTIFSVLLSLVFSFSLQAQSSPKVAKKEGWHLMDARSDGYMGISLEKAYELLADRKSKTVIVAVIDSGLDTLQEDLRPVLWRNPKEIAGNGKDDDGNGYPDDIYGWNFAGSKDGINLEHNSHEVARVYHNWRSEFEGKKEKQISADQKFLYSQWVKSSEIIERDYESASKELPEIENLLNIFDMTAKTLGEKLSVTEFGAKDIVPLLTNKDEKIAKSAAFWENMFKRSGDPAIKQTAILKEVTDYRNSLKSKVLRKTDPPVDNRGKLTGDRYTDINDRFYGNNNLGTGSGDHGTLVAGVIAAARDNNIGIDGIADNVRIMAIRAVPGGDEHDKDVALAIRYAVDNGASIINMSFGKPVSPYKQFVDDAVKYAASKGVLLIHGSGNDGVDITKDVFYPNPVFLDGSRAQNFLTVGASGDPTTGGYAANFSNYSATEVDLFAPGTYIYSTASGNRYVGADGTSLAAPVVSGVAALLKSYFPELTPTQLVKILKESGQTVEDEVFLPGDPEKKTSFSTLSSSGRIVNAYEAVKLALRATGKK
jgi:subtilisin family serine protease